MATHTIVKSPDSPKMIEADVSRFPVDVESIIPIQ